MAHEISVRELRNHTSDVLARVRRGEPLTLTVNRMPVADIVPHSANRTPWVSAAALRAIIDTAPADAGLLEDLADVRGQVIEDDR